jgi:hypothetical protein
MVTSPAPPELPANRQSSTSVRDSELEFIRKRKADASKDRLFGLAISGGGIRSATFALGVLETLKERKLLPKFHYLSTVSGGGYIGGWLSANCHWTRNWLAATTDWSRSIDHLRRYSNYLSPQVGFFSADTWSMVTIWIRNTLLIQATVILAIACALLLPRPLLALFEYWPKVGLLRWATIFLYVLGIVGVAGNHLRLTSNRDIAFLRDKAWWIGGAAAVALGLVAYGFATIVDFEPFAPGEVDPLKALPVAAFVVGAGFCLQPTAVKFLGWLPMFRDDPPRQINYSQGWVQSVVIIPLVIAAYLVAAILWGEAIGHPDVSSLNALTTYGGLLKAGWKYWPFPLSVVFVSFWMVSVCSITNRQRWWTRGVALLAPAVAVAVLHAQLAAIVLLFQYWANAPGNPAHGVWLTFVWGPPQVAIAFVLSIVVLIGMIGRDSTDGVREWWSRLGAWLGIYATAWMVMAVTAVYGPLLVDWLITNHPWKALGAGGGWVGTVIGGLMAGQSESTGGRDSKSMTTQAKEWLAVIAPFVFIGGLLVGVSSVLHLVIKVNAEVPDWWTLTAVPPQADSAFWLSLAALAACFVALLLMAARVDINEFSLNAFYRNRLVRCYLGAARVDPQPPRSPRSPQNFTGFDDHDDLSLARMAWGDHDGPLHLVNCALNLGGSSDLALHTRHGAAFTLSPLTSGSAYMSRSADTAPSEIGYVATDNYAGPNGPTLGQAIAVSGAAASPNMGYHTSPVTAFLLTLFNVRLGWWFPNPADTGIHDASPWFSLRYLVAELFGEANDKSKFVMVSDGGHFENLAAYELLRRQCRVIVISDGECDPNLAFEGLGTLIRMCEVDFGYRIEIDVNAIRHTSATWSGQRHAIGRIRYGSGTEDGVLIYLKASMTGHEDTSILQYKSTHPLFPHETTGDQFYGEDQFESYRRLGRELAAGVFPEQQADAELSTLATGLLAADDQRRAGAGDRPGGAASGTIRK